MPKYSEKGETREMKTVMDIAEWFLSKDSMTHKQLQKLCYYAQAWYCALYDGTPLFDEKIEAWVHGPVVASLYQAYASFGWNSIEQKPCCKTKFTSQEQEILDAVYSTYGSFSGDQLEALTHSEQPWIEARGTLKPWETSKNEIPIASMRKYYKNKYEQAQGE